MNGMSSLTTSITVYGDDHPSTPAVGSYARITGAPGGRCDAARHSAGRTGKVLDVALGEVVGADVGIEAPDELGEPGCLVGGDV